MHYLFACILLLGCQSPAVIASRPVVTAPTTFTHGSNVPGIALASPPTDIGNALLTAGDVAATPLKRGALMLAGHKVTVDIADTFEARRQGLSGRKSLPADTGLILAWDQPEVVSIWMPDMNFPIDVIFVAGNKVTGVYANEPPCAPQGPCPDFGPNSPVDFVIEVPAGSAAAWGVTLGTPASYTL
jgi:uncharacterized membrane protein (UPF0127 family)